MSRQANEHQYRSTSNGAQKVKKSVKATFVVFRPDADEKAAIRADKTPIDQLVHQLIKQVLAGNKVSIGYRAENDSIYFHLRDGAMDWDKAVTLSVFHTDHETALRTLCYGLRTRYSTFPDVQLNLFDDDVSW